MVMELMIPPTNDVYDLATDTYTLSKTWAVGIIGTEGFKTFYVRDTAVKVHTKDHEVYWAGRSFGLCGQLLTWLTDRHGADKQRFPA
jgi:hypothetical protein